MITELQQEQSYAKLCQACGALLKPNLDMVERMLQQGIKAYNENYEKEHKGRTCLSYLVLSADDIILDNDKSSFKRFTEVFNKLCEQGADPSKPQGCHGNLLCDAIAFGHAKVAIWLIEEKGFDVNGRDAANNTPLYHAIFSRQPNKEELVKLLVQRGARASYQVEEGKTLYDMAPVNIKLLLPKPNVKPAISIQEAWQVSSSHPGWSSFFQGALKTIKDYVINDKPASPEISNSPKSTV
jgi:ankyrin repeat protein